MIYNTNHTPVRKTLMLTLTHNCNLACVYCYEGNKSNHRMTLDTAKKLVAKYLSTNSSDYDEVEISFHGGEPFLCFSLLRSLCEWTWSTIWNKPYIFFATTNGTLIHKSVRSWVEDNKKRFYLSLSLDGTPEMHNQNRSNSYHRIDPDFFYSNWPDQPVKMTVSNQTLSHLTEGIIYLHEKGLKIQCNLAQGIDWSDDSHANNLTEQLALLISYYLDHPHVKPCDFINLSINIVGLMVTPENQLFDLEHNLPKKWCGVGTSMVATDIDGTEYPCHVFLPVSAGDKSDSHRGIDFSDWKSLCDVQCQICPVIAVCPTCYAMNTLQRGHPSIRDENLCKLTKIRALACSKMQAIMLAEGDRYPFIDMLSDQDKLYTILGIQTIQKHFLLSSLIESD